MNELTIITNEALADEIVAMLAEKNITYKQAYAALDRARSKLETDMGCRSAKCTEAQHA